MFSKNEILIILRTYLTNPCDWETIVENCKLNISDLPLAAQSLYFKGDMGRLKHRVRDKFGMLMKSKEMHKDPEIQ